MRLLFLVTIGCALALAGAVAVSPLLDSAADGEAKLLWLFAHDVTVRRTALAGSAGLLATAFVFFRSKKPVKPKLS